MTAKIQVRRDTSANWNAGTPPTLASGELGLDTTLNQLKAGDNTNPWNTLPWLGATLPAFSSPSSTDLNDSSNRVMGIYRFSTPASITNGPTAPMDIKAADVGATMMVSKVGSVVVQQLWTDGDTATSIPPKSWSRTYDGTNWDPWTPQSNWGIGVNEGTDTKVRDLEVQRFAKNINSPTWNQFAANLLPRADAFGALTLFGMQHFSGDGTSLADLSNQTSSITWNVSGIGTATVTVTPSAGTWWGMAVAFGGGSPRQLLVITTRQFTAASGAAFTLASGGLAINNVFIFLIRAS